MRLLARTTTTSAITLNEMIIAVPIGVITGKAVLVLVLVVQCAQRVVPRMTATGIVISNLATFYFKLKIRHESELH